MATTTSPETTIAEAAPAAYISDLDLEALAAAYERAGEPAVISNHAGAYLCNHAYYVVETGGELLTGIDCNDNQDSCTH